LGRATRLLIVAASAATCLLTSTASAASLSNAPDRPGYTLSAGGEVHAIVRSGDTIYIGGLFTTVNGQPRTNLAALSAADGSLTSWAPTTNGEVDALAGSGSTIYAGGAFTQVTGAVARNGAAAFNTAGAVLSWDPDPNVASIAALVVEGSHVYLGGSFGSTNNGVVATTNLARVDPISGAADASWHPNPNASVNGLVSDGTFIYPIGGFGTIGGQTRNGLGAVSIATGAADAAWDPSDSTGGGFINAIAISPDRSTIYVTGDFFATYGGGGVCPPQCSMGHADRSKAAGLETAGSGRIGNATA
jgi:trimeric autotransporter adhesin